MLLPMVEAGGTRLREPRAPQTSNSMGGVAVETLFLNKSSLGSIKRATYFYFFWMCS